MRFLLLGEKMNAAECCRLPFEKKRTKDGPGWCTIQDGRSLNQTLCYALLWRVLMYKSRVDANEWAIVDSAVLQGTLGRLRWLCGCGIE